MLEESSHVVLDKIRKETLGSVYFWRLDREPESECQNKVYVVKGSYGLQFVVQTQDISRIFDEGNYKIEEINKRLYTEALKQARNFARKYNKEFVNNTERGKRTQAKERVED